MALTTYTELKAAIADYLARSDLTDAIPDFITLAEAKFNRDLVSRQMEGRSTTTIDTASTSPEFISLPTDFRSMRWVRLSSVTGKPSLNYLSPAQMTEYRYARGNGTGQPAMFTIIGEDMEICPTADANYTVEMVYRKKLTALSGGNPSNWLLVLAPDLYLYGALAEASAYMKDDTRIGTWATGYQNAIEGVNRLNIQSAFNAGPIVMSITGTTP